MNTLKIMKDSERFMKRTEAYQEHRDSDMPYKIEFVLAKGNVDMPDNVIAYATRDDEVISFNPYKDKRGMSNYLAWSFDYDTDLFGELENGYEIVGMPLEAHYNVWATIAEWHDGDIDHLQGVQMYLGYCKRNSITHERLQRECSYDGMDVMSLYDGKTPANMGITTPQKEYEGR